MISLSLILESLVLVTALSIDTFVACFAYGTNKIKIPFLSAALMDFISGGILLIFLSLGRVISPYLPQQLIRIFCFAILFGLGILKLFDSYLKTLIRKNQPTAPYIHFSFMHFRFILTVYADPDKADMDQSHTLSPREAISLGVALSLDSAAVGFGAGVLPLNISCTVILSLAVGACAIFFGCLSGNLIADKLKSDLSWLSGILLIVLAFMKFF
ncbi:sporulation membrane protein YtaF [Blautia liquoris]|uniref:Sporulation membrane protein YtaF n=1 Tax=Blautia liquoris TaxID=2779518 RepID=A0A7M2RJL9_9FIRM|nr:sporulation membrane protein YtaF [Blautia liquoris]QOV19542.1 sporulation membrane protein YtaF [Blautia liquoris]